MIIAPENTHTYMRVMVQRDMGDVRLIQYSVYSKYQITIKHLHELHGKNTLIPHTRVINTLPWTDVKTAANINHRCCNCITDNVALQRKQEQNF